MPDPIVVLIEDEPQIRRFLRATLSGQGYRLFEAATGADGLVEVGSRQPDVIIIDLGLPDMDGVDVIRRLREWTAVPIIVLSARGQERDKVTALDAGADDYVSKPFGASELVARIRVALRHAAGASHEADEAAFKVGELQVDRLRRHVSLGGTEVRLTIRKIRGRSAEERCCCLHKASYFSRKPVRHRSRFRSVRAISSQVLLLQSRSAHQPAHPHRLDGAARNEHQRTLLLETFIEHVHRAQMESRGIVLVRLGRLLEGVGDLHLGLAEDDARLFLTRGLCFARHRVLQRGRNDDVAHFDRLYGDAPRIGPLIDELLQFSLDALTAAQQGPGRCCSSLCRVR